MLVVEVEFIHTGTIFLVIFLHWLVVLLFAGVCVRVHVGVNSACVHAYMHVHCADQHACWLDKPIGSKYIICTTVILWHSHGMLVVYTDIQYMEQNTTNCRKKIFKRSVNSLHFITTLKTTFLQRFVCKSCLVISVIMFKESRTQKTPKMVHEM